MKPKDRTCDSSTEETNLPCMAKDFFEPSCARLSPDRHEKTERIREEEESAYAKERHTDAAVGVANAVKYCDRCAREVRSSGEDESSSRADREALWGSPCEVRRRLRRHLWQAMSEDTISEEEDEECPYDPVVSPFSPRPRFVRFRRQSRLRSHELLASEASRLSPQCSQDRRNQEEEELIPAAETGENEAQSHEKNEQKKSFERIDSEKSVAGSDDGLPEVMKTERKERIITLKFASTSIVKRLFVLMASVLAMTLCISAAKPALFPSLYFENRSNATDSAMDFMKGLDAILPDTVWFSCPWQTSWKESPRNVVWNGSLALSMDSTPTVQVLYESVDKFPKMMQKVAKQIIDWCTYACAQLFADHSQLEKLPTILEEILDCEIEDMGDLTNQVSAHSSRVSVSPSSVETAMAEEEMQGSLIGDMADDIERLGEMGFGEDDVWDIDAATGAEQGTELFLELPGIRSIQRTERYFQETLKKENETYRTDREREGFDDHQVAESQDGSSNTEMEASFCAISILPEEEITEGATICKRTTFPVKPQHQCSVSEVETCKGEYLAMEEKKLPNSNEFERDTDKILPNSQEFERGTDKILPNSDEFKRVTEKIRTGGKENLSGEGLASKENMKSIKKASLLIWSLAIVAAILLNYIRANARSKLQQPARIPVNSPTSSSRLALIIGSPPPCTQCGSSPTAYLENAESGSSSLHRSRVASPAVGMGSYLDYVQSPGKLTPVRRSTRLRALSPLPPTPAS